MEKEKILETELALAGQFLDADSRRRRAYVCSPLNADTGDEVMANMYMARDYMKYISEHLGYAARAPHGYLPMLLSDWLPSERSMAVAFGMRLLEESDVLMACGNRISHGMKDEICRAVSLKMDVFTFSHEMYEETVEVACLQGLDAGRIVLETGHPFLAGMPGQEGPAITREEYKDLRASGLHLCGFCKKNIHPADCRECQVTGMVETAGKLARKENSVAVVA